MELLSVLRVLARRPLLVALGLLAAAVAGVATGEALSAPAERRSAVARSEIQIDTPNSLLVDLVAIDSALRAQTVLLADQLAGSEQRAAIAHAAGIAPARLTVLRADAALPPRVSPLATRAAEAAATARSAYVLTVSATTELPVISIRATGADSATVGRLAQAPTTVLQTLTAAAAPGRGHSVRVLTPVEFVSDAVNGGRNVFKAVLAFIVLAVLSCIAIVILDGVARARRVLSPEREAEPQLVRAAPASPATAARQAAQARRR